MAAARKRRLHPARVEAVSAPAVQGEDACTPLYAFAFLIAAVMWTVSVTGLLWRIDAWALGLAGVAALGVTATACRRFRWGFDSRRHVLLWLLPMLPLMIGAALVPPITWDEVAYSAALPRDYAAAHRFFYNDDYGPYSAFPGNYEALTTIAFALQGSALPAKLLNVVMGFGLALGAVQLCRLLGVQRTFWPPAALLVIVAPTLLESVSVVKNDIAQGLFQVLAVCACAQYLREPRLRWIMAAGALLGSSAGIKYSSLQFAVTIVPCFIIAAALVVRQRPLLWRHLAVFAAVAAAVALPWYARNLIVFGNPFFPFFESVLGAGNQFGPSQIAIMQESFGGIAGYSLGAGAPSVFFAKLVSGFGIPVVLFAVPGAALLLMRDRSATAIFLVAVPATYTLFTLFFGFWEPRYILVVLASCAAFTACFVAEAFERLARVLRWCRPVLPTAMVCMLLLASGVWAQYQRFGPLLSRWMNTPTEDFHRASVSHWRVAQWINANATEADYIGVGVNVQPFLYLQRHYLHIHPISEKGNLQSLRTPQEFLAAFRSLGLTKLAFAPLDSAGNGLSQSRNPRLHEFLGALYNAIEVLYRQGVLKPVAQVDGVTMFEMVYGASP